MTIALEGGPCRPFGETCIGASCALWRADRADRCAAAGTGPAIERIQRLRRWRSAAQAGKDQEKVPECRT